jgi:putative ATPase
MSLFGADPAAQQLDKGRPLAERLRPESLDEFVGQEHILAPGKPLRAQIERDELSSLIFWGPPGVGKTTLARLIARMTKADFVPFSAVLSGMKEIKAVMADAERNRRAGRRTVLFIDEIHRFNKAQQDAFLPYVERGDITLIGATTENPSFEVISALLSRAKVHSLRGLTTEEIRGLLERALRDAERGLGERGISASAELLGQIGVYANGDARAAYNVLELAVAATEGNELSRQAVEDAIERKLLLYDKSGEEHYNLISALHKSVRSSDPDAALYWLARMLDAGEDRLYIARRLIRMAIEDVGLADPRAVEQAVAAMHTVHFLGIPEGDQALAQVAIYLSVAPKSDAAYQALNAAVQEVRSGVAEPVPNQLRNPVTRSMREWGYGKGYEHAHQLPDAVAAMECLPPSLAGRIFYTPTRRGVESRIGDRLAEIRKRRHGDETPETAE